jgi:hypothetical protein
MHNKITLRKYVNKALKPISTPKMSLLKVENFQLQFFFPTENLCRPITFYKIFFPRKIFLSENGPLYRVSQKSQAY